MSALDRSEFVLGRSFTLPRVIYSGDMLTPHQLQAVSREGWSTSFVYHVFDRDGELLYVGLTATPYARWCAHRRRAAWWPLAATLNLYEVRGKDRNAADAGARHWEARAIHGALPSFNLAGPASLPAKLRAKEGAA